MCAAAMLAAACSVKDDRIDCPSVLELDLNEVNASLCPSIDLLLYSDNGFRLTDTLDMTVMRTEYNVPRDRIHIRAWSGGGRFVLERGLDIPLGKDCPRVYMYDSDVEVLQERWREIVMMRKGHCVLTLKLEGEGIMNADLYVVGNVSGYDVEGRPCEGDFNVRLEEKKPGSGYVVVLPRQLDSSLRLLIDDGSGTARTFALGQYITSSGYDWDVPDLDDISVTLDYALTEATVVINGWESVYKYEIEI